MSAGGERVLTQRELNRALLERQLLLSRRREALPTALERLAGIQAQYAPSMYIGLWSRLADFQRDSLTRALERRAVVQATLMRSTIHLVSRADYRRSRPGREKRAGSRGSAGTSAGPAPGKRWRRRGRWSACSPRGPAPGGS